MMISEDDIILMIKEINLYAEFNASTELFEEGIIDSLSILFLISMIEEKFSVKIPERELRPENFATISNITDLVNRLV